jgi:hypothetical protein
MSLFRFLFVLTNKTSRHLFSKEYFLYKLSRFDRQWSFENYSDTNEIDRDSKIRYCNSTLFKRQSLFCLHNLRTLNDTFQIQEYLMVIHKLTHYHFVYLTDRYHCDKTNRSAYVNLLVYKYLYNNLVIISFNSVMQYLYIVLKIEMNRSNKLLFSFIMKNSFVIDFTSGSASKIIFLQLNCKTML